MPLQPGRHACSQTARCPTPWIYHEVTQSIAVTQTTESGDITLLDRYFSRIVAVDRRFDRLAIKAERQD